ncbi:MAG: hypothetical protein A2W99_15230 [Bacteroidetes bacterium GWF2_33_16]|nr:MAG: hypothetical protein A2X00_09440 [Bacteroidetes bacterium GWE2_32_14]OFY07676.1 MAG: hypothetical protein A2W99_15230 [Bacteroidetes bacterium GWF2_33_16]
MDNNKPNNVNWDILVDILSNTASEQQKLEFENWLKSETENAEYFNQIQKTWLETGNIAHCYSDETNFAWGIIKSKTIEKKDRKIGFTKKYLIPLSVAACFTALLLIGKNFINPEKFVLYTLDQIALEKDLPDNSKVDLNFNSQLIYSKYYNRRKREVWLTGEAFFDVKKDKEKPFIIHTSHGNFKVLGTSFNISSYNEKDFLSLTVKTGVVEFFPKGKKGSIKVSNGYKIQYNKNNFSITKSKYNNENFIAWKNQTLDFANLPLVEVAQILEGTFNIKIVFKNNNIKELPFTANFKNQPVDKILKVIAITFDLEVENSNEKITFKQKN